MLRAPPVLAVLMILVVGSVYGSHKTQYDIGEEILLDTGEAVIVGPVHTGPCYMTYTLQAVDSGFGADLDSFAILESGRNGYLDHFGGVFQSIPGLYTQAPLVVTEPRTMGPRFIPAGIDIILGVDNFAGIRERTVRVTELSCTMPQAPIISTSHIPGLILSFMAISMYAFGSVLAGPVGLFHALGAGQMVALSLTGTTSASVVVELEGFAGEQDASDSLQPAVDEALAFTVSASWRVFAVVMAAIAHLIMVVVWSGPQEKHNRGFKTGLAGSMIGVYGSIGVYFLIKALQDSSQSYPLINEGFCGGSSMCAGSTLWTNHAISLAAMFIAGLISVMSAVVAMIHLSSLIKGDSDSGGRGKKRIAAATGDGDDDGKSKQ